MCGRVAAWGRPYGIIVIYVVSCGRPRGVAPTVSYFFYVVSRWTDAIRPYGFARATTRGCPYEFVLCL